MEGVSAKEVVQKYMNHKKTQSSNILIQQPEVAAGTKSVQQVSKLRRNDRSSEYIEQNLSVPKRISDIDFSTKSKDKSHIIVRAK